MREDADVAAARILGGVAQDVLGHVSRDGRLGEGRDDEHLGPQRAGQPDGAALGDERALGAVGGHEDGPVGHATNPRRV
jgi:hypothetical protein